MRRWNRSQIDQNNVMNNGCYVVSTLKVTLLQLTSFLTTSTEYKSRLLEGNFEENLVKNLTT